MEANKDVLVVFAVFNIHTKFEGAFQKTIVLSGPIPAQAAVNKGHDIVACVQDPVSECYSLILNVLPGDEVVGCHISRNYDVE